MATKLSKDASSQETRGQARTRFAQRAVVATARTLFLERGYAATTIESISKHSDVPVATVYRLFSSKLGILKAVLEVSVAGDDQGITLQGRPEVAALFAEPDPAKLLSGFAGITVAINQRCGDLYRILASAAAADQQAADLQAEFNGMRDQGQGLIAAALARTGSLRRGLKAGEAADLIHALMSPELYRLLVIDRGWTPKRYQQWLAVTLVTELLPAAERPRLTVEAGLRTRRVPPGKVHG